MPMLVQHIDKIARDKKRDVLSLVFHLFEAEGEISEESEVGLDLETLDLEALLYFDYEACKPRQEVMKWLTANGIQFCPCLGAADEQGMQSYAGQLYIDVPFDENDPVYQKLRDYLENPDGTMKISGITFCYYPLEMAMKNAHHDEPGFWEEWEKDF